MSQVKDLIGRAFGRLIVTSRHPKSTNAGRALWVCTCACGNTTVVSGNKLLRQSTISCGCHAIEKTRQVHTTHGHSVGYKASPTYSTWSAMMRRCYAANTKSFVWYGKRGIDVCKEWHDFTNFLKDMGEKPNGMSIERIDNNRGYSQANCRWATPAEQSTNRGNNVNLTHDGKTQCIAAWSKELGIHRETIRGRLRRQWPIEKVLATVVMLCFACCSYGDPVADQIDECRTKGKECHISLPPGNVIAERPWVFDFLNVRLESAGAWTQIQWVLPENAPFCISTVGCEHLSMARVQLTAAKDRVPQVVWLAGRTPHVGDDYAQTVGKWDVRNCWFTGPARKSVVYFVGIECETVTGCWFTNNFKPSSTEPGYALYLSDNDDLHVSGEYEHNGAYVTSASHLYTTCNLGTYAWSISALYQAFALGIGSGVHDLRWQGGSTASGPAMTAVVHIRGTGNYNLWFDGVDFEAKNSTYVIQVDAYTQSLWLTGGLVQSREAGVRLNANATGKIEPGRVITPKLLSGSGKWN